MSKFFILSFKISEILFFIIRDGLERKGGSPLVTLRFSTKKKMESHRFIIPIRQRTILLKSVITMYYNVLNREIVCMKRKIIHQYSIINHLRNRQ